MDNCQEKIEIEIDSELLYKVKFVAALQGLSPEEYISNLVAQYIASRQ